MNGSMRVWFGMLIMTAAFGCSTKESREVDGGADLDATSVDGSTVDAGFMDGAVEDTGAVCNFDCRVQQSARMLDPCDDPVLDAFSPDAIDPPRRGSNEFTVASTTALAALNASLAAFGNGDGMAAMTEAAAGGYQACRDRGDASLALWRPFRAGLGHAVFALRVEGARPVIVESPHPNFEVLTATQSVGLFELLPARALVMAGAHRCANSDTSGCDGTTSVCGMSEPYRVSDMAHVVDSFYHAAHVWVSESYATDWVVSVHGMSGAGVSLSDGSGVPLPDNAPVARLFRALQDEFPNEMITSCNPFRDADVSRRLCGSSNVQGRHLNDSSNACNESATGSTLRFIHLEQSRDIRTARDGVTRAFARALRER